MSESTWKRAKKAGYAGELTRDQMLRLSAIVGIHKALELYFDPQLAHQWVKLPNRGPEFDGARPVDTMIARGLPKILRARLSGCPEGRNVKVTAVKDHGLVRRIPETRHKPPVLRGLVDSDEEAQILAELEGETSQRLIAEREGSPAIDRRELAFARRQRDLQIYGQSHINVAFTYLHPHDREPVQWPRTRRLVLQLPHADLSSEGRLGDSQSVES